MAMERVGPFRDVEVAVEPELSPTDGTVVPSGQNRRLRGERAIGRIENSQRRVRSERPFFEGHTHDHELRWKRRVAVIAPHDGNDRVAVIDHDGYLDRRAALSPARRNGPALHAQGKSQEE